MEQAIPLLAESGVDFWGIVKWFYVAAFIIALTFSLVVMRQIQLMSRTLEGGFNGVIHLLGVGLALMAGTGLVAALLVL
jgi:hypothetical protein